MTAGGVSHIQIYFDPSVSLGVSISKVIATATAFLSSLIHVLNCKPRQSLAYFGKGYGTEVVKQLTIAKTQDST